MTIKNLAVFLVAAFCLISFSSCTSGNAKVNEDSTKVKDKKEKPNKEAHDGLHVGDIAPDFSLKGVDGNMTSLASYKDVKGYIVTFTCNHCPYAVMYEDRLIALHLKMAKLGYPVVAINPNDPAAKPEDSFDNMMLRAAIWCNKNPTCVFVRQG